MDRPGVELLQLRPWLLVGRPPRSLELFLVLVALAWVQADRSTLYYVTPDNGKEWMMRAGRQEGSDDEVTRIDTVQRRGSRS